MRTFIGESNRNRIITNCLDRVPDSHNRPHGRVFLFEGTLFRLAQKKTKGKPPICPENGFDVFFVDCASSSPRWIYFSEIV